MNKEDAEQLRKLLNAGKKPTDDSYISKDTALEWWVSKQCPSCGHCPTCGRGGTYRWPRWPHWPPYRYPTGPICMSTTNMTTSGVWQ